MPSALAGHPVCLQIAEFLAEKSDAQDYKGKEFHKTLYLSPSCIMRVPASIHRPQVQDKESSKVDLQRSELCARRAFLTLAPQASAHPLAQVEHNSAFSAAKGLHCRGWEPTQARRPVAQQRLGAPGESCSNVKHGLDQLLQQLLHSTCIPWTLRQCSWWSVTWWNVSERCC